MTSPGFSASKPRDEGRWPRPPSVRHPGARRSLRVAVETRSCSARFPSPGEVILTIHAEETKEGFYAGEPVEGCTAVTETSVRWEIEARGEVRKVGYRDFVEAIARKLGLTGSVENDKADPDLVRIFAQGPAGVLEAFRVAISGEHGIIHATSVTKVSEGAVDPKVTSLRQVRGSDAKELQESAEASVKLLGRIWTTGKETRATVHEGHQEILRAVREGDEVLGEKVDRLADSMADMARSVGSLASSAEMGFAGLGKKLDVAVAATSHFERDLTTRFDRVDSAYGMIGKTLLRIERALEQQTKAPSRRPNARPQLS